MASPAIAINPGPPPPPIFLVGSVDDEERKPLASTEWRVWFIGRCVDTSLLPQEQREHYERLKAEGLHSGRIPTVKGIVLTRAEAVRECRDKFDYIFRVPFGGTYGDGVDMLENYCRPFDEGYEEINRRDAATFDLAEGTAESKVEVALKLKPVALACLSDIKARLTRLEQMHEAGKLGGHGHDHSDSA